ncbi:hypothetical protein FBUS_00557 [Fasciolopsis buskii]|uniref:Uncharacterized protein n=1 Tax=Fasciolopsis buskii TaxID=27845 RepID=A0A8E0RSQ5_9TREM|nr:hypothetical protein FBUS_00557 [Fasciolopsis buski]
MRHRDQFIKYAEAHTNASFLFSLQCGDGLHRTDSLIKRSNVIGADESAGSGQRILLPYPDYPEFDISQDDSAAIGGHSSSSSRSHSLASRLRSSRLLGSGMLKPGRRGGVGDEVVGSTNSLALLGPSRQLAGVVASMSTLPSDAGTSPSSAAALASAVAVAGATGSWQQPRSLAAADQISSQTGVETPGSNVTVKTTNRPRELIHETDPPVRYVPPAASVAAELPGTYTAISQPRRSEASNLGLFKLFRHRKKRFRSVGAEKLLYLENNDLEEFDAMSTEGYYRIVQDADFGDQSPTERR